MIRVIVLSVLVLSPVFSNCMDVKSFSRKRRVLRGYKEETLIKKAKINFVESRKKKIQSSDSDKLIMTWVVKVDEREIHIIDGFNYGFKCSGCKAVEIKDYCISTAERRFNRHKCELNNSSCDIRSAIFYYPSKLMKFIALCPLECGRTFFRSGSKSKLPFIIEEHLKSNDHLGLEKGIREIKKDFTIEEEVIPGRMLTKLGFRIKDGDLLKGNCSDSEFSKVDLKQIKIRHPSSQNQPKLVSLTEKQIINRKSTKKVVDSNIVKIQKKIQSKVSGLNTLNILATAKVDGKPINIIDGRKYAFKCSDCQIEKIVGSNHFKVMALKGQWNQHSKKCSNVVIYIPKYSLLVKGNCSDSNCGQRFSSKVGFECLKSRFTTKHINIKIHFCESNKLKLVNLTKKQIINSTLIKLGLITKNGTFTDKVTINK